MIQEHEMEIVTDYLDSMTLVIAEIACDIVNGRTDDALRGLRILLDPSAEAVQTVDIEAHRRKA